MSHRITRTPPAAGSVYKRNFNGRTFRMTIVMTGGQLGYRVGGRDFKSPSGAAKSVTGFEVNGWRFWRLGS